MHEQLNCTGHSHYTESDVHDVLAVEEEKREQEMRHGEWSKRLSKAERKMAKLDQRLLRRMLGEKDYWHLNVLQRARMHPEEAWRYHQQGRKDAQQAKRAILDRLKKSLAAEEEAQKRWRDAQQAESLRTGTKRKRQEVEIFDFT